MAIKQIDGTSPAIKERLDKLAGKTKSSYHAGETLKLGFAQFMVDVCGISEPKEREAAIAQAMATPGWFGCGNNSACRQHFENPKKEATLKAYTGI